MTWRMILFPALVLIAYATILLAITGDGDDV